MPSSEELLPRGEVATIIQDAITNAIMQIKTITLTFVVHSDVALNATGIAIANKIEAARMQMFDDNKTTNIGNIRNARATITLSFFETTIDLPVDVGAFLTCEMRALKIR